MKIVQNPVATCDQVYALIQSLTSQIRKRMEDPKSAGKKGPLLFHSSGRIDPIINIIDTAVRIDLEDIRVILSVS